MLKDRGRSKTDLINGKETITSKTAMIAAPIVINVVSLKNWKLSWRLLLPKTLRMLTSLARFIDCAVERFIKLTQAITNIKRAINLIVLINSFEIALPRKLPEALS